MSRYIDFGIDLGTTNSCITRMEGGGPEVIQNNDQMNVTPSVVRVLKSGSLMTGRRAYNAIVEDPDNVALEFKRVMGQKSEKTFPASGRVLTPEELSAEVLKALAADARRRTGVEVRAACITVPAAFTALQCEATARAAQLAGLEEYPLLQEPIAAAIAYGARPEEARDQRWLVFDLGGGTLDVAVISTRGGRLHVLEHRGDNHLGGKDIDRLVVENIFLPFLSRSFALPRADADAPGHKRLFRKLAFAAEYAKIELTSAEETIVSFLDLGEDDEGRLIEAELTLTRAELEREVGPLLARCLRLTDEALAGARRAGRDLDRILLVGGPTQMPLVRAALEAHLGAAVDSSLDPMTVVARGAAIYASTVERRDGSSSAGEAAAAGAAESAGRLPVRLAFEPVSAAPQTLVAGKFGGRRADEAREVRVDADNGFWTSGWHAVREQLFEIPLVLQEGQLNRFLLSARDARGRALEVEPGEFQIRHGLTISAPPLPHTISVEVSNADGTAALSTVFPRRTLLPAEKTVTYRAAHTLRPSEPETSLAIKLWEGEALTDPQANTWVGNMHIESERVRRPVPEGAELHLHIKVDASRLITVEVFIPHLNEHFTESIFVAKDEEPDYLELLKGVPVEIENYLARLERLEEFLTERGGAGDDPSGDGPAGEDFPEFIYEGGDLLPGEVQEVRWGGSGGGGRGLREEAVRLRRELEDFDLEVGARGESDDQDYARGVVERLRELRARLAGLEGRAGVGRDGARLEDALVRARDVERVVESDGTAAQRDRFDALYRELKESGARGDTRGMQKAARSLVELRGQILLAQDWFWEDWFRYMQRPGRAFVNREEAARWLAQGEEAMRDKDRRKLEQAVRWLWSLEPVEEQTAAKERGVRPGLRE
ncbi:MAG: Hsp70 family protein [Acidobacteria bacterium]|nr:Hsp70 family protein [Acidobacteriota bacterium]